MSGLEGGTLLSTSLGFLLMFSVLEETKIGVRPGTPTGNLGGVMGSLGGEAFVVISSLSSFLLLLLSCCSL